ncbi:MAG TPA: hypothetical protein VGX92_01475 [Pyrinomonadaceae bacterium]|jgi:hypothetical protein|nr:hypothetical protein [Pyrinomonadaceae bacterium]
MERQRAALITLRLVVLALIAAFASFPAEARKVHDAIRRVDFRNFTYLPSCAYDGKPVRMRGGTYSRDRGDDKMFLELVKVAYGDLTNDGRDEAVVITTCNTGGTGHFTEGTIYTMRGAGRAVELARLEEGDRAFGGIRDVRVERGRLVVERFGPEEPGTGACCPKYVDTISYRWNKSVLAQMGETRRREFDGKYTPLTRRRRRAYGLAAGN